MYAAGKHKETEREIPHTSAYTNAHPPLTRAFVERSASAGECGRVMTRLILHVHESLARVRCTCFWNSSGVVVDIIPAAFSFSTA